MVRVPWSIGRDMLLRARGGGEPPARRSLYACGWLVGGYALAAFALPGVRSVWWFALAPAAVIVAVLMRGWAWRVGAGAAVLLLGAGWYASSINERAAGSIAWAVRQESAGPDPALVTIRGVVIDTPEPVERARGVLGQFSRSEAAVGCTLALSGVEDSHGLVRAADGMVRVSIEGTRGVTPAAVFEGAAVRVSGKLRPVRDASNPGEPDWPALAAQEGRVGDLDVASESLVEACDTSGWRASASAAWHRVVGGMHARCRRAIAGNSAAQTAGVGADGKRGEEGKGEDHGRDARATEGQARALLGALLLGERDASLADVNTAFQRLGVLHLVAISGFNLMIMAAFARLFLRLLGERMWLETGVVGVLVLLYMLVLPAQAPILRAGFLVLALLIVEATGRRYDRATTLGWIALGILLWRPMDAWSLGFQLSFGIVAALLLVGSTVHHRLWGVPLRGLAPEHVAHGRRAWEGWWWRWIPWLGTWLAESFRQQISAGLVAWMVSIPIIVFHTGQVGVLTPLMTLIVLPLTVIVLWGGYALLLPGVLVPGLEGVVGNLMEWPARLLVRVVMWLDAAPGTSVQLPSVSVWWALAAVAGAVYLLVRGSRREVWSWAIALGIVAWAGVEMWTVTRLPERVALRIDSLAVGDGSCHLLRRGEEAVLWDCGSLSTGMGERLVPRAMRALGVRRVPVVVVTHAHIDHFAGLPDVVDDLHVERVYVPEQLERAAGRDPASAPGVLLAELCKRGVLVRTLGQGDEVELVGLHARVLWPPREREFRDTNDSSLVVMLPTSAAADARRVLLTGDAAREALANLLPADDVSAGSLRADVLELPHHGAFNELAVELVRVVGPRVVIQSTGARRAADARWLPVLSEKRWLATPRDGAGRVEIGTDGTIRADGFLWR